MKILLFLVFIPIAFYAQNNEITAYVEVINDIHQNSTEDFFEGPLTSIFGRSGGWRVYFVNDGKEKKSLLKTRFLTVQSDRNTELKLYYRDDKLLFGELTILFTEGKLKNEVPFIRQFYLPENEPRWHTENENEDFKKIWKSYNFKYLFQQDKLVRGLVDDYYKLK